MKKKEIVQKYVNYIRRKQKDGATLDEIAATLAKETGEEISPQYISTILKNMSRRKRLPRIENDGTGNRVDLYRNGKKIGTLAKVDGGFVYAAEAAVDAGEQPIASGFYPSFPSALENLLPEGPNRERIALEKRFDPKDDFRLLASLNDGFGGYGTHPGEQKKAVSFSFLARSYTDTFVKECDITVDKDLVGQIVNTYYGKKNEIPKRPSSLSGQQPKFVATFDGQNRLRLPPEDEHSNAVIKVSNKKFSQINLIENMLLFLARERLGIKAPRSFVLLENSFFPAPSFAAGTHDHLVVERFDRYRGEPSLYQELLALMEKTSDEKYEVGVEEIFETVDRMAGTEACRELARRYLFFYLAGNGDAHAKNVSLGRKEGGYFLAPMYDVVNTHIYGFEEPLGIPLGGRMDFGYEDLVKFLQKYAPIDELRRTRDRFFEAIETYLENTPFDETILKKLREFYDKRREESKLAVFQGFSGRKGH